MAVRSNLYDTNTSIAAEHYNTDRLDLREQISFKTYLLIFRQYYISPLSLIRYSSNGSVDESVKVLYPSTNNLRPYKYCKASFEKNLLFYALESKPNEGLINKG